MVWDHHIPHSDGEPATQQESFASEAETIMTEPLSLDWPSTIVNAIGGRTTLYQVGLDHWTCAENIKHLYRLLMVNYDNYTISSIIQLFVISKRKDTKECSTSNV